MGADDSALFALGPLDGRYREQLKGLSPIFSEAGLIGFRLKVEAEWLLHLASIPAVALDLRLSPSVRALLEGLRLKVPENSVRRIKELEQSINHDVKAVEYHLRDLLQEAGADPSVLPFIHFACTSEDINNISYALMLNEARQTFLLPIFDSLIADLRTKAGRYAGLAMLSRTHGQVASPTTLGKEMAVFGHRLARQRDQFAAVPIEGKINGAVGNYNAHLVAYPMLDWPKVAQNFVEQRLGLKHNPLTTQIENHDSMIEYCDVLRRFNVILLGLARDIWSYISLGYFQQKILDHEVGSSTMPHKVNPIDFENAEGNLGLAIAMAQHFAEKLPISRWQRDLSDSTVQRSLGTMLGYSTLAYKSMTKGLSKLKVAEDRITLDVSAAWEVLAEPIQTVMRRFGVGDAYERLKTATRGQAVTKDLLARLVSSCDELPPEAKAALEALTPEAYIGYAARLATEFAASK